MKEALVDVPVKVNIWIRTECQRKQFEVIKKARPSVLFLQSDGGRNEFEWNAIYQNRKIFDTEIDWQCKVYKIYEDSNLGLYEMGRKVLDIIWSCVDRCVFLEDDQIPAVSYFRYCAELLEKYKDDLRIDCICGMNHLGISEEVTSDYFFARQGSIWGTATWRRTTEMRDEQFAYGKDDYVMKLLKQRAKHNPIFLKRAEGYLKNKYYEGHVASTEFFREFAMYGHNQLQIIPKVNMISNIGCTEDSEHADSLKSMPIGIRRVFNMEIYEMEFPMKHAKFVIPDVEYEKKRNRIMGYNRPLVACYRKFERGFRKLWQGDIRYIVAKLRNNKIEH